MAFCIKCGIRYSDDDLGKHECNPEDVPAKGEEVRAGKKQALNAWKLAS